jgi:hypothetical protein
MRAREPAIQRAAGSPWRAPAQATALRSPRRARLVERPERAEDSASRRDPARAQRLRSRAASSLARSAAKRSAISRARGKRFSAWNGVERADQLGLWFASR